jgi:hypothetical protein
MRAAAVAFYRYGKDIHANVAQRARHDFGAPEGSQNLKTVSSAAPARSP